MKRVISNLCFYAVVLILIAMQADTWLQARATNDFIQRLHEVVQKGQ